MLLLLPLEQDKPLTKFHSSLVITQSPVWADCAFLFPQWPNCDYVIVNSKRTKKNKRCLAITFFILYWLWLESSDVWGVSDSQSRKRQNYGPAGMPVLVFFHVGLVDSRTLFKWLFHMQLFRYSSLIKPNFTTLELNIL